MTHGEVHRLGQRHAAARRVGLYFAGPSAARVERADYAMQIRLSEALARRGDVVLAAFRDRGGREARYGECRGEGGQYERSGIHASSDLFVSAVILRCKRLMQRGNVRYWSTPQSSRLSTVCSECCHDTTYTTGRRRRSNRMRRMKSDPSMNGATASTMTKSGLSCMQAATVWRVEVQHTTRAPRSPTMSAIMRPTMPRREYMTIFPLFISSEVCRA